MPRRKILLIGKPVSSNSVRTKIEQQFEVVAVENSDFEINKAEYLSNFDKIWLHVETRLTERDLSLLTKKHLIATTSTGTTHIHSSIVDFLKGRLLTLKSEPAFLKSITSTADLSWALILAGITGLFEAVDDVKSGHWDRSANVRPKQLKNLSLGIIGFGRLGQIVANYAKSFGCTVYIWDIDVNRRLNAKNQGFFVAESITDLLSTVDIATIHVSTTHGSPPILSRTHLELRKKGLIIVNTSRGSLVEESGILWALEQGVVSRYLTDVLECEESGKSLQESPLWRKAQEDLRIVITPHIGGASADAMEQCEWQIYNKITKILE